MDDSPALVSAIENIVASSFNRRPSPEALEHRVYRPLRGIVFDCGEAEVIKALEATAIHLRRRDGNLGLRGDAWLHLLRAILRNRRR